MNEQEIILLLYFVFFCITVAFSFVISKLMLNFSKTLGIRDLQKENETRWAKGHKPSLGGIAFFIVFLLSVCSYFIFPFHFKADLGKELIALIGSVGLGFFVGFYDDAYNTNPLLKLMGQILCALLMVFMGIVIPLSPYILVNYAFTILWVVFIMNSINMLDNMDGITSSVAITILLAALLIMEIQGDRTSLYFIITVGVCGALSGFLIHNWHPSKIFMGDSGSQFLGAFLAFISIETMWAFKPEGTGIISIQQFLIPLIAFIIPIIDTTTVIIRRLLKGNSPFIGGKDHTTHMLAYNGLSDEKVALVFFFISFLSAVLIYFMLQYFEKWNIFNSFIIISYAVFIFAAFQYLYNRGLKKQAEEND